MALTRLPSFTLLTTDDFTFGNVTISGNVTANYLIGNGSQLTGLPASYTDTNANSAIDARVTKSFIDNLNVDADTLDGLSSNAFATASQGSLADSAVQPGNLSTVATTGSYTDLINKPTLGTAAATNANAYATAAQGTKADTAIQTGANISVFTNDSGYLIAANLSSYATQSFVSNTVANLVNSAPAALDTLNELATALGNDASYSTTVTNALANKLSTSAFTSTADTWLGTKTTSNVTEGTNLYYTVTRANTAIDNRVTKSFVDNLSVVANVANVAYSVDSSNIVGQVSNSLVSGTVYTNAQPNITSVGTLTGLTVNGNVSANYFIGNGSQLTGLPASYSDANVAAYLPTFTGNLSPGNLSIAVDNLHITGGTANYVLQTDGAGNLSWVSAPTGGGSGTTTPASVDVTIKTFTANGVQTSFTLDTTPTASKLVTVNYDGVVLLKTDYTVTGANVIFNTPPANGSKLEVTTLTSGSGSGAYTWNEASSNITMQTLNAYFVDTSTSPITMTLPATPTRGDSVKINDMAGTFGTNNLTIGRNSEKIQGVADNLIVDYNQATMELVYCNSTYGWKVIGL